MDTLAMLVAFVFAGFAFGYRIGVSLERRRVRRLVGAAYADFATRRWRGPDEERVLFGRKSALIDVLSWVPP